MSDIDPLPIRLSTPLVSGVMVRVVRLRAMASLRAAPGCKSSFCICIISITVIEGDVHYMHDCCQGELRIGILQEQSSLISEHQVIHLVIAVAPESERDF